VSKKNKTSTEGGKQKKVIFYQKNSCFSLTKAYNLRENLQNNVMFELRIKTSLRQPMFEIKNDARRAPLRENFQNNA